MASFFFIIETYDVSPTEHAAALDRVSGKDEQFRRWGHGGRTYERSLREKNQLPKVTRASGACALCIACARVTHGRVVPRCALAEGDAGMALQGGRR
jgi:hypothetical protein